MGNAMIPRMTTCESIITSETLTPDDYAIICPGATEDKESVSFDEYLRKQTFLDEDFDVYVSDGEDEFRDLTPRTPMSRKSPTPSRVWPPKKPKKKAPAGNKKKPRKRKRNKRLGKPKSRALRVRGK